MFPLRPDRLILLVLAAVLCAEAAGIPKQHLGVYTQPGPAGLPADQVKVSSSWNGKPLVDVKLYFGAGHTCTLKRKGEWRGDRIVIEARGLDADRACRLEVLFKNGSLTLSDAGLKCSRVYCGTRGRMDQVELPKVKN